MKILSRSILAACVLAALNPLVAGSAHAQSVDGNSGQNPSGDSHQKATKKPAIQNLGQVVVTAQKRVERVEDAPVSVAVVSGDALTSRNVSDISDLNNIVPSANLNSTMNGRTPLSIRGISTDTNEAAIGVESGVATLIDGVPVPSDAVAANDLEDVARVEVLTGPQSTLGGRAASAGVINVVTHSPTDYWTGSASSTFTNDNEKRVRGFISGPISKTLSFSLAGWGGHTDYPIVDTRTDQNTRTDRLGGRLKLQYKPNDSFDATLALRASKQNTYGSNWVYSYITPGAELFPYILGTGATQAASFPGITVGSDNRDYNTPVDIYSKARDREATLTMNYQFSNGTTFTSTSDFQSEKLRNQQPNFLTATHFWNDIIAQLPQAALDANGWSDFNDAQPVSLDTRQVSQEFKLVSPEDQEFSYILGAFYSRSTIDGFTNREFWGINPYVVSNSSTTSTYDVYGRGTWKLGDNGTSLIAGLRYDRDVISYAIDQIAYSGDTGACTYCTSSGSNHSGALVGDLTLQQKVSNNQMFYLTYSRGYKPRAYNTADVLLGNSNGPSGDVLTPVKQEHINSFELGSKGVYLDGRLVVNASIYDTKYNGYQVQTYASTTYEPLLEFSNAGAKTRGAELTTQFNITPQTRFDFNAAYTDAKFTSYENAPCYNGQAAAQGCYTITVGGSSESVQDVSGKTMPLAPKFKASLSLQHRISLPDSNDLTLEGNYAYRTKEQFLPDQNPRTEMGAFGLMGLSATLTHHGEAADYAVTLFANNIFNKTYYTDMTDWWSGLWAQPGTFAPANAVIAQRARDSQRYFGLRLSVDF